MGSVLGNYNNIKTFEDAKKMIAELWGDRSIRHIDIANHLNTLGIPNQYGSIWSDSNISNVGINILGLPRKKLTDKLKKKLENQRQHKSILVKPSVSNKSDKLELASLIFASDLPDQEKENMLKTLFRD